MTRRIEEHPPELRLGLMIDLDGSERQHLILGNVEVVNVEVEMELLGRIAGRPRRWSMVGRELERESHVPR